MANLTLQQFQRKIQQWVVKTPQRLKAGLTKAAMLVERTAQERYLTDPRPERLGVRSGKLRRSLHHRINIIGGRVEATVGTNVVYARIHEKGGAIMRGGRKVGKMPARPYLGPALEDNRSRITQIVAEEILKAYG